MVCPAMFVVCSCNWLALCGCRTNPQASRSKLRSATWRSTTRRFVLLIGKPSTAQHNTTQARHKHNKQTHTRTHMHMPMHIHTVPSLHLQVRDLLGDVGSHKSLRVREHKILGPYVEVRCAACALCACVCVGMCVCVCVKRMQHHHGFSRHKTNS